MASPNIGLALGSGSARGWAHIGVIRVLTEWGIKPDIICGCSIGALVGGAYAAGRLDDLEAWLLTLKRKDVIGFFDVSLMSGGLISGEKLMGVFRKSIGDPHIESLPIPFSAIATELETGRETWLRSGSVLDAVRASISMPGIFTPVRIHDRWLVDGGLINPVPVSTCRAMGADIVIAVNMNGSLLGRHLTPGTTQQRAGTSNKNAGPRPEALPDRLKSSLKSGLSSLISQVWDDDSSAPGIFDVMATSINIMQDRITRSRMAGDPPDLAIMPRLEHIGLLEFYRVAEAIEEGKERTRRMEYYVRELVDKCC